MQAVEQSERLVEQLGADLESGAKGGKLAGAMRTDGLGWKTAVGHLQNRSAPSRAQGRTLGTPFMIILFAQRPIPVF
jgi:hypothetical protein